MLPRPIFLLPTIVVLLVPGPAGQGQQYVKNPVTPRYRVMTADELKSSVKVRSSRSYAAIGYNVPEILVELPKIDNSVYAEVKFDAPVLVDDRGKAVKYQRINGIYDHDSHSDEIRMATPAGDPVSYSRAKGSIRLRYPIAIRSDRLTANDAGRLRAHGMKIAGREVEMVEDSIPQPAPFTPFQAVRAYDASGRMLAPEGGGQTRTAGGVTYRKRTYAADVKSVEVDRIEKWVDLSIRYDLPRSPMRKAALAGTVDDPDPLIAATPKGTTSIEVVPPARAAVSGAADLSREEITRRLASFGIRTIDDKSMINATMRGNVEAIRLLLAAGVSPDAKFRDQTALLLAASIGKPAVVVLLARAGANVNARDSVNSTALITLANHCRAAGVTEAARALIDAGADVNAKANGGGTALMMADVLKCSKLASVLRAAGAR